MTKPLIGIPCDRKIIEPHPFHVVGEKYIMGVVNGAEGTPLIIPALGTDDLERYLDMVDGVMLSGSPSNIEPHHYHAEDEEGEGALRDLARDATTLPLIPMLLERGIPLFGICRGFQEINVALGGKIHQKVHEVENMMDHREDKTAPVDVQYGAIHPVHFTEGGLFESLTGEKQTMVNSIHGQGIKTLGNGLVAEAKAPDGIVEGYRLEGAKSFCVGVQWHPEWKVLEHPFYTAIFKAFGDACRQYAASK